MQFITMKFHHHSVGIFLVIFFQAPNSWESKVSGECLGGETKAFIITYLLLEKPYLGD